MAKGGIFIQGGGIAACCCARLLQENAWSFTISRANRPKLPAILLSAGTQNLLRNIFRARDLFTGLPKIRKRIVAWQSGDPVVLPHLAVVAPEQGLLERLWARIGILSDRKPAKPEWTIITGKPAEILPSEMRFGSRRAFVTEVVLGTAASRDACWVESVEDGWLFLLPTGEDRGSLICVGAPAEQLLEKSRLVAPQVQELAGTTSEFAAYPRILSSLAGKGWFACGAAAMSFDPMCGGGAGNAARAAILACAAVRAIRDGESAHAVRTEYSLRLLLGFYRHLANCQKFYRGDSTSAFWSSELHLLQKGVDWSKKQLREALPSRFRLVGFELERVASRCLN